MKESRKRLLLQLENIIGRECYNSNIQNWAAFGVLEGKGRNFRYPLTLRNESGEKIQRRNLDFSLSANQVKSGHYAFGANQLYIIDGLEKVLEFLEDEYGFDPK